MTGLLCVSSVCLLCACVSCVCRLCAFCVRVSLVSVSCVCVSFVQASMWRRFERHSTCTRPRLADRKQF